MKEENKSLGNLRVFGGFLDGLTGLYNYQQFRERLKQEIHQARQTETKLFLIMLDVDGLKEFNKRFSYATGDQILKEIAKTLQGTIAEAGIAARYGGEEFAILLPNCDYEKAGTVASQIRYNIKGIRRHIESLKNEQVEITVSMGIACYPDCTNDLNQLIDIAGVRMLKGKELGGDKVIA